MASRVLHSKVGRAAAVGTVLVAAVVGLTFSPIPGIGDSVAGAASAAGTYQAYFDGSPWGTLTLNADETFSLNGEVYGIWTQSQKSVALSFTAPGQYLTGGLFSITQTSTGLGTVKKPGSLSHSTVTWYAVK